MALENDPRGRMRTKGEDGMFTKKDYMEAKQVLSAHLLRKGLEGNVIGRAPSLLVESAVAAAGRNVHAVGIGRKEVKGQKTSDIAIRIYVVQKVAVSLLPLRDRLPATIEGIPTDVIEAAPAFALPIASRATRKSKGAAKLPAEPPCSRKRRELQRPLVAGISCGHHDITAGTLACFCRSTRKGDDPEKVFVLSNNHVFANVNKGRIGDALYQPGPADGGTIKDRFADLHRFVRIRLSDVTSKRKSPAANRVDAAIGALRKGIEFKPEVCSIGRIKGTANAKEGMAIRKHGRTSGYTEGEVTDESYDALVGMDPDNPSHAALFENQMRLERTGRYAAIGLGGDSGSLVVMKEKPKAVGLFFAGPPGGVYGVANPIQAVLSELEIALIEVK
jgi:hypothetical protein